MARNIIETFKPTNAVEFELHQAAGELSDPMRHTLLSAHTTPYSVATAIGTRRTLDALRRRGLIADDNRWTARGRIVAAIARGGQDEPGHVRLLDELHAEALTKNAKRQAHPSADLIAIEAGAGDRDMIARFAHAEALRDDRDRTAALSVMGDATDAEALHEDALRRNGVVRAVVAPQLHPVVEDRPRWAAGLDLHPDRRRSGDGTLMALCEGRWHLYGPLLRRLADAEVRAARAEAELVTMRARVVLSA